jgi:hypothetical protein
LKERFILNNRKAQVWTSDFIIGFMIFAIGALLASRFIIHSVNQDEFLTIRVEGESVTDALLSEGLPTNWTNESVSKIGLTTSNRLNVTKVSNFYNISYNYSRVFVSSNYDFLLFFEYNGTVLNITRCGYGAIEVVNCTINISGLEYNNLVKTTRLVVYNHSIAKMVLYLWD